MLACRTCRIALSASYGCAICNPIRKHLINTGEDEEDKPSLSTTGSDVVAALRGQLKLIRKLLKDNPEDVKLETRLLQLANTVSKVLESARKIQQDGVAAVENMSFAEQAELFITWLTNLPPDSRKNLRGRWDEWEIEASRPLALKE